MKKQVVITTSKETTRAINRNNYTRDEVQLMKDTLIANPFSSLHRISSTLSLKMGRPMYGLRFKLGTLAKEVGHTGYYERWSDADMSKLKSLLLNCKYGEREKTVQQFAKEVKRTVCAVENRICGMLKSGEIKGHGKHDVQLLKGTGTFLYSTDTKSAEIQNEERKPAIINVELPKGFTFEGASRKIEFCGDHVKIYF